MKMPSVVDSCQLICRESSKTLSIVWVMACPAKTPFCLMRSWYSADESLGRSWLVRSVLSGPRSSVRARSARCLADWMSWYSLLFVICFAGFSLYYSNSYKPSRHPRGVALHCGDVRVFFCGSVGLFDCRERCRLHRRRRRLRLFVVF